jgi:hypothetical protein
MYYLLMFYCFFRNEKGLNVSGGSNPSPSAIFLYQRLTTSVGHSYTVFTDVHLCQGYLLVFQKSL